jgi:DUF971 family protein
MSIEAPRHVGFGNEERTVLRIEWADGHESRYPLAYLRGWCPCAGCQGHSGETKWVANEAPALTGVQPTGAYAVGLHFADGHATGIYSWEWLRDHCPCEACGGPREGTPPEALADPGGVER